MICIVDYDAGNLRSVQKAIEHLGAKATVTSCAADIEKADKIIFPGVGAFGKAMESLQRLQLVAALKKSILQDKYFLGICLGMQLLFETSEENPGVSGLAVLKGQVNRFPDTLKVPHLGWNTLEQKNASPLWMNIPEQSYFYFAHSYYINPAESNIITGICEYGITFPVAVKKSNLYGLQFHPEKSQKLGLQILDNFINL